MRSALRTVRSPHRRALGAAVALVLACLWIAAPLHAHETMVSGFHDATPKGCPHKSEQGPCSLCRLAREMSPSAPAPQPIATLEPTADVPATACAAEPATSQRGGAVPRAPPLRVPPNVAD